MFARVAIATRLLIAQIARVLGRAHAVAFAFVVHLTCGFVFARILDASVNLFVCYCFFFFF